MIDWIMMWAVISAFAIGVMLAMQAARQAKHRGDRTLRILFYTMSGLIALVGLTVVKLFLLSRIAPG